MGINWQLIVDIKLFPINNLLFMANTLYVQTNTAILKITVYFNSSTTLKNNITYNILFRKLFSYLSIYNNPTFKIPFFKRVRFLKNSKILYESKSQ